MKKNTPSNARARLTNASIEKKDEKYDELMREYDKLLREFIEDVTPFIIKDILGIDAVHMEDIPDPVSERRKARSSEKDQ